MSKDRAEREWAHELPGVDAAALEVLARVGRAQVLVARALDAGLAQHGVTRPEFDALAALRRAGAPYRRSAGALATAMDLSPAATTNRVDRLVAAGLVERHADPDDARGVVVGLTPRGAEVAEAAVWTQTELARRLLRGLGPLQERTLAELLTELARSVAANAPER